ncbi:MAG: hypothetical protein M1820_010832 [Bogoriella megaspora]|nr:MAG: hypothetical protein M1820_010832 [Bogoriella megaspora]
MSKTLQRFGEYILQHIHKFYGKHTPGKRILPPRNKKDDENWELRIDAGESQDGKKTIYLQVNSEAKNDALKKFRNKNGAHANLAVGTVDENTPEGDREDAIGETWKGMSERAKEKIG